MQLAKASISSGPLTFHRNEQSQSLHDVVDVDVYANEESIGDYAHWPSTLRSASPTKKETQRVFFEITARLSASSSLAIAAKEEFSSPLSSRRVLLFLYCYEQTHADA